MMGSIWGGGSYSPLLAAVFALLISISVAAPIRRHRPSLAQLEVRADGQLQLAVSKPSLKEYCSGKSSEVSDGKEVLADWRNYGHFYPGRVTEVNKDGTYDILYNDGWVEKNVRPSNIKDPKAPKGAKGFNPKDDPACELSDLSEELDKEAGKTRRLVARYVAEKKAEKMVSETEADEAAAEAREKAKEAARAAAREVSEDARAKAIRWGMEYKLRKEKEGEKVEYDLAKVAEEDEKEDEEAAKEVENEELEGIKSDLEDTELEIHELELQIEENDKKLRDMSMEVKAREGWSEEAHKDDPSEPTLDDLIQAYRRRLEKRRKRREELRDVVRDQAKEMERLSRKKGEEPVTVHEIDASVREIEEVLKKAEEKRAKLEKEGRLDDELNHAIDEVADDVSKMHATVDKIKAAEARAKAAEAAAKAAEAVAAEAKAAEEKMREEREKRRAARAAAREARRAARAARRATRQAAREEEAAEAKAKREAEEKAAEAAERAQEEAERAEEAAEAEEAARLARAAKEREEAARKAEEAHKELVDAGKGAEEEMQSMQDKTDHLNRGVTPYGAKWWRYRYEYSYIEAGIMIWIVFLMLIWEWIYQKFKRYIQSFVVGGIRKLELAEQATLGTLQQHWLENFADMLVVCVLTFLTVWVLAKLHLIEHSPIALTPADSGMHMPSDEYVYRRMAIDLCAILFFAVLLYFCLTYAVVRTTAAALQMWQEEHDRDICNLREKSMMTNLSTFAMENSLVSLDYAVLKTFFTRHAPQAENIDPALQMEMAKPSYPFWLYLRLSVKGTVGMMYDFGVFVWLLIVVTFFAHLMLHLWAHVGYVRIMMFYASLTTVLLLTMTFMIYDFNRKLENSIDADQAVEPGTPCPAKGTQSFLVSHEWLFFSILNYFMFMLCYGFSRMVCQTWMWELHFWNAVYITFVTLCLAIFFVLIVAPLVPLFAALSMLPPHINERHKETAMHCAEGAAMVTSAPVDKTPTVIT